MHATQYPNSPLLYEKSSISIWTTLCTGLQIFHKNKFFENLRCTEVFQTALLESLLTETGLAVKYAWTIGSQSCSGLIEVCRQDDNKDQLIV